MYNATNSDGSMTCLSRDTVKPMRKERVCSILKMDSAMLAFLLLASLRCCSAELFGFNGGNDLNTFVSNPMLRPPLFEISQYSPQKVSPGYWFLAPYSGLNQARLTSQLELCQVGPHIFDNLGHLVWSGACEVHNSNVFDFKVWNQRNTTQLSFILMDRHQPYNSNKRFSVGVVMNHHFDQRRIHLAPNDESFNMHEFTVVDEGKHGLALVGGSREVKNLNPSCNNSTLVSVWDGSLLEFDMATGESIFKWNFLDHIPLNESSAECIQDDEAFKPDWNHPNSIDKDADGDYLVSSRYTDAIYKISSKDGSISWRLGGKNSSFTLQNFNFSRQHDARFRGKSGNKAWISFLNNAGDDVMSSGITSAGYLVELDTTPSIMSATLIKQWRRPDGNRTRLRGNVQALGNGNTFISWSENGYITEYDTHGDIALEARFVSHRFVTYRAYKFDFVGRPRYPPSVRAIANGIPTGMHISVYMSWNGATDIHTWKVFAGKNNVSTSFSHIGSKQKDGFETVFTTLGHIPFLYVEAIDKDGRSLGVSDVIANEVPIAGNGGKILAAPWTHQRLPAPVVSHRSGNVRILGIGVLMGIVVTTLAIAFRRNQRTWVRNSWVSNEYRQIKQDSFDM